MARLKVGVSLQPQHTTIDQFRDAWRRAEAAGVDSIWLWDHFFPLFGDPDGSHFETWTLLAAMAADTSSATVGTMVSCNGYRNPDLLAHMAQTVSLLSGGRLILGIGAGWFERDFDEYGYQFGTPASRLAALRESLPRIKARLARVNPPVADLPILIGGGGEKLTLRLVAEHADLWNTFGPPDVYRHKSQVLDDWCRRLGRDPAAIERTVNLRQPDFDQADEMIEAGARQLIFSLSAPFDLAPVKRFLRLRDAS